MCFSHSKLHNPSCSFTLWLWANDCCYRPYLGKYNMSIQIEIQEAHLYNLEYHYSCCCFLSLGFRCCSWWCSTNVQLDRPGGWLWATEARSYGDPHLQCLDTVHHSPESSRVHIPCFCWWRPYNCGIWFNRAFAVYNDTKRLPVFLFLPWSLSKAVLFGYRFV